jgi:hypothetical protein
MQHPGEPAKSPLERPVASMAQSLTNSKDRADEEGEHGLNECLGVSAKQEG